ncbi:hypothetical protein BG004_003040 [Podila humilis]|nr:hypothetical protein BG004_003040 [Podila humilis]
MVPNQQGSSEDQAGQSQSDSHHSVLDERALVPYDHGHVNRQTLEDPEETSLTSSGKQPAHPRQESNVVTLRMERRRQQAVDKGAGIGVLTKLFDSKAALTRRKRQMPGQQAFILWMQERGHDALNPSAMDVMNFLNYGLDEKKWKLTTVHTYKSAILQLLSSKKQLEIKEDDLFKHFLKVMGTTNVKRIHNATVDLAPILKNLQELGDNHNMDIKNLTAKTCFLLATCGLLRPDDLACTDTSQSKIVGDKLELIVMFPKERRGRQMIIKTIVIKSHPVEFFCPVKAYVEYRRRTSDQDRFARTTHPKAETELYTPLIRHVNRSNLGLSSDRISKYIQEIMKLMPRDDNQRPYKARAVGTTAALERGIPLDDVVTHGNWSSPAIVEAFYRISRSLATNFTTAIFS